MTSHFVVDGACGSLMGCFDTYFSGYMASSKSGGSSGGGEADSASQRSFLRPALSGMGFRDNFGSFRGSPTSRSGSSSGSSFLRPSVLTATAELLRTDKVAVAEDTSCEGGSAPSTNNTILSRFLVVMSFTEY